MTRVSNHGVVTNPSGNEELLSSLDVHRCVGFIFFGVAKTLICVVVRRSVTAGSKVRM